MPKASAEKSEWQAGSSLSAGPAFFFSPNAGRHMSLIRRFKLKDHRGKSRVTWLNRHTVYEGKLISMTSRIVRLYAPNVMEREQHVDVSYDWVTPVQ
jgi:hypothetical protein